MHNFLDILIVTCIKYILQTVNKGEIVKMCGNIAVLVRGGRHSMRRVMVGLSRAKGSISLVCCYVRFLSEIFDSEP